MKKLALITSIVAAIGCTFPASAEDNKEKDCSHNFFFAEQVMIKYMDGEILPVLINDAGRNKDFQNIVDDAFNYKVPTDATDRIVQMTNFAIKHLEACQKKTG